MFGRREDMQLKKKLAIKKHLAAGAVTAVMLFTSLPAMASDGLGLEGRFGLHLGLGGDDRKGLSSDVRELQREIKEEAKEIRKELKNSEKSRVTASASVSVEVTERKQCKKMTDTAYKSAVVKAREEREAGFKAAQQTYLNDLKAARDAFRASMTASASGSQATVSTSTSLELKEAARKAYRAAVKKAQKTFSEAKKSIGAAYHDDLKAAKSAREQAAKACKA